MVGFRERNKKRNMSGPESFGPASTRFASAYTAFRRLPVVTYVKAGQRRQGQVGGQVCLKVRHKQSFIFLERLAAHLVHTRLDNDITMSAFAQKIQ
jgi:hypothetical protein